MTSITLRMVEKSFVRSYEFEYLFSMQPSHERLAAIHDFRRGARVDWSIWMFERLGLVFPQPLFFVGQRLAHELYTRGSDDDRARVLWATGGWVPWGLMAAWGVDMARLWLLGDYLERSNCEAPLALDGAEPDWRAVVVLVTTGHWPPPRTRTQRAAIERELDLCDGPVAAHMGAMNEAQARKWRWLRTLVHKRSDYCAYEVWRAVERYWAVPSSIKQAVNSGAGYLL